jgi:hypothetical protein
VGQVSPDPRTYAQHSVRHLQWCEIGPPYLVRVHNYTKFGGRFPAVPGLLRTPGDLRTLWYLISVLEMIPEMWEMAIGALSTDMQWMGWVPTFVAKQCYETKHVLHQKIRFSYCGQTRFSKN